MDYIKNENLKYVVQKVSEKDGLITVVIKDEDYYFGDIKDYFTNLDGLSIYSCIEQRDSHLTDEFEAKHFYGYYGLKDIKYDVDSKTYTITLQSYKEEIPMLDQRFYVVFVQYNKDADAENRTAPKAYNTKEEAIQQFHEQMGKDMKNSTLGWSIGYVLDNLGNNVRHELYVNQDWLAAQNEEPAPESEGEEEPVVEGE